MKPCSPAQVGAQAAPAPPPDSKGTLASGSFAEVQQLEHHWDQLSAERKTSFAQMAALTRFADKQCRCWLHCRICNCDPPSQVAHSFAVVPCVFHEHAFLCCSLYMYGKAAAEVGMPTRDIAQLLSVFACNNHTICNTELQPLGMALTPARVACMHACMLTCC
jgi:hypothetical protein